jgi:hypothetical protein
VQDGLWTWGCTGEVTVNFFSARAELVVRNNSDPRNFYGWYGTDMTGRLSSRQWYFGAGVDYAKLCASPGLYLDSFLQLVEVGGFGFELLRNTIRSYRNLTNAEKPTTESQEIQRWILQQSRVAGYNFGPYYKAWGWPVADATTQALASLPTFTVPDNRASPPPPPRPPLPKPPSPPPPRPPFPPFTPPDRCVDYAALTSGVTSTDSGWYTNVLVMWGQAIPLIGNAAGDHYVAASRYGYGTAVVYGHEALMGVSTGGLGILNKNVILWASGAGASSAGSAAKTVCYADSWCKGVATAMVAMVSDTRD